MITGKRIELRQGTEIWITKKEKLIINSIADCLSLVKRATLTEVYAYVHKQVSPSVDRNQIKYCLMILYIRHKVKLRNFKGVYQKAWRTYVQLNKNNKDS